MRSSNLVIDIRRIEVSSSTAVPISLTVNEFVTNAFKYAFPADQEEKIQAPFPMLKDCWAELKVVDDGVGHPADAGEELGTRLTNLLCRQLNSTFKCEGCSPGSTVTAVLQV